jgi:hypothetical protein
MSKPMLQVIFTMEHSLWVEDYENPDEMLEKINSSIESGKIQFKMTDLSSLTDEHHEYFLVKSSYKYFY